MKTDQFQSLYEKAVSAAESRDFEKAVDLFNNAIALDPSHAEAYYKRGNALKNLGRFQAAIVSYDQAIERRSDYAHAYCNRGVTQQALGLAAEAMASYDVAISLDPGDVLTHYNRALLLQEYARWEEVLIEYERAITIDPTFADAQYNRALALLFCGDLERGWRSYEWRWKNGLRLGLGEQRDFAEPLWLGDKVLEGKRILLHSEGGLGDTLQFCRYASLVSELGATVYLEVQPPLYDLLSGLQGVTELIVKGNALPCFDYHCPLMSLPLAFNTTLDTVPPPARYLRRDKSKFTRWHSLQRSRGRPRIGLVWSGNPKNVIDQRRSVRLADWVEWLPEEFEYFRLQRDVREDDKATLRRNPIIQSESGDVQDFSHIAALCDCMDLVISVDTSLAHLSGTLGRPTWVLLPFTPDWRWLRDRVDSPWYPTMKLFRQKTSGNWSEVFERVATELRRAISV